MDIHRKYLLWLDINDDLAAYKKMAAEQPGLRRELNQVVRDLESRQHSLLTREELTSIRTVIDGDEAVKDAMVIDRMLFTVANVERERRFHAILQDQTKKKPFLKGRAWLLLVLLLLSGAVTWILFPRGQQELPKIAALPSAPPVTVDTVGTQNTPSKTEHHAEPFELDRKTVVDVYNESISIKKNDFIKFEFNIAPMEITVGMFNFYLLDAYQRNRFKGAKEEPVSVSSQEALDYIDWLNANRHVLRNAANGIFRLPTLQECECAFNQSNTAERVKKIAGDPYLEYGVRMDDLHVLKVIRIKPVGNRFEINDAPDQLINEKHKFPFRVVYQRIPKH